MRTKEQKTCQIHGGSDPNLPPNVFSRLRPRENKRGEKRWAKLFFVTKSGHVSTKSGGENSKCREEMVKGQRVRNCRSAIPENGVRG
jgi:hypothetical protein